MKVRRIKNKIYRNRRNLRKASYMKFIDVGSTLYPLNDRVVFSKDIHPNDTHHVLLSYTDNVALNVNIGDSTNFKELPFEKQVEKVLIGKIKEIKF